jgi:hypothetical protein
MNSTNIVEFAAEHGTKLALQIYTNEFMKGNTKNRHRVLKGLVKKHLLSFERTSIIRDALTHNNRTALAIHVDFYFGNRKRYRKLAQLIKKSPKQTSRPHEQNFTRHPNVELSKEDIIRREVDTVTNFRRRAADPMPCVKFRKISRVAYAKVDEEQSWDLVLPGGRIETAKLTLEDKLLFPASVRGNSRLFWSCVVEVNFGPFLLEGLCPQLQELFRLSTCNEYALPFPLKSGF